MPPIATTMLLKRIYIQNFRNIAHLDIRPSASINLICGPNGSGKTSFLEALSCIALGRSFRGAKTPHLIKHDEQSFVLSSEIEQDNSIHTDTIGIMRSRTRGESAQLSINGQRTNRLIDIIDKLCIQVIHPQGTELVTGSPEQRRAFLDWGIYYSCPQFKEQWLSYRRILDQRNALLKDKNRSIAVSMFSVWDDMLCDLSESITKMRENYLAEITSELTRLTSKFLPEIKFDFSLSQGWEKGLKLRDLLSLNIEKDRNLGYTFYGCHRADLKIKTNQSPASETLSRGQIKLLVCAMRLSQGSELLKQTNKSCVYLVDDINSELDQHSRSLLLNEILEHNNQLFITNITNDIEFSGAKTPMLIDIQQEISRPHPGV